MTHPDGCACRTCRLWEALRREGPTGSSTSGPTPTAAELERHARRFGPEGVEEAARAFGVELEVERPKRKRGARGPTLKERVAGYVAQGHDVDTIAELEQLSRSRARRLIEEVKAK